MPRKSADDLQKHTLNLFRGDMDKLRALFPDQEPSVLVRDIIRATIDNIEASVDKPKVTTEIKL
jgi:hypothetical protein